MSDERILTAALVLTGPADEVIEDGAVRVRDGVFADVGPRREVVERAAPDTPVLDLAGATLLPGLIDCHVHLAFDASEDPVAALRAADDRDLLLDMAGRARRLLDAGVTTARDLGDRGGLAARLRDAIEAGTLPGPRLLTAGPPITVTGGHCWFLGGAADGADRIRERVRRNVADGADVIKVMSTGGSMTAGGPPAWQAQFSVEEVTLVVAEAARFGRRVAAHAHGTAGIEVALAAGVHTLEHCSFVTEPALGEDHERRDRLIREIAARGVAVCPTFSATLTDVERRLGPDVLRPWLDLVRRQYEAGVRLIAGTDAGIAQAPFEAYAQGLEWYVRAGLPPRAVLEMATTNAADALGLADRIGRIAIGLDADAVVVDDDPRTGFGTLADPRLVLRRGRPHVPAPRASAEAA
ncbi:amidohydrolase family protein [Embleya sp. NPDC056575]|uniref:amidohydrolase family protein n=1 Tax=unclassified Embleya TaxID=2699296 RepID=UPI0036908AD2